MHEQELRQRMRAMGLRPNSVKVYVRTLQRLSDHLDLDTCQPGDLFVVVEDIFPPTWSSRKLVRSALRSYWKITGRLHDPMSSQLLGAVVLPRKPRFQCRAITEERARLLAETAETWDRGAEGLAVMFGLYAALRRFEIAKVRWDDVVDGWLRVEGKGGAMDEVPLHPKIITRLEWWQGFEPPPSTQMVDCRTRPGAPYVFSGSMGRDHVSPATIWNWAKKVACEAGIGDLETHELRHTCLATVNDQTQDLRATQEFARHVDPATTVLYTRVKRTRMEGLVRGIRY